MNDVAAFFQNNPYILLIGFVASVITVGEFFGGWLRSFVREVWADILPEPQPRQEPPVSQTRPANVVPTNASEPAKWIAPNLVQMFNGFGEDARYNYFAERVAAIGYDNLYRTAFIQLKMQPEWSAIAIGLEQWTKTGFAALTERHPKWKNEGTMNALYAALHKELMREDHIRVTRGIEFADAWSALVREWRCEGY